MGFIKERIGQQLHVGKCNDKQRVAVWQTRTSNGLLFWFLLTLILLILCYEVL